ncbi:MULTISPECIES: hypothetical protein [Pseudomonas]|uniref:hypothetical protein n=1 Tax=Pseudomonas TaxID=286 RepID=UPI0006D4868B|nr:MULTISPECIES: hypothetical protein [Pseudomonas]UJW24745.1 hypothetical protein L2Y89_11440 [Pseudomonas juntendi]
MPSAQTAARWCPDECPITGRKFFMWIEHPDGGMVPTYGGPFDSYTIPTRDGDEGFFCERYDHDYGGWRDDEIVGLKLIDDQSDECEHGQVAELQAEIEQLKKLLDTPHTADWFEGVKLEAGHQVKRWGSDQDAGKAPADWFWLIGYLAQKAMIAHMSGDQDKARHHTISTGAAMLNWFRQVVGDSSAMRPGLAEETRP